MVDDVTLKEYIVWKSGIYTSSFSLANIESEYWDTFFYSLIPKIYLIHLFVPYLYRNKLVGNVQQIIIKYLNSSKL